MGPRMSQLHYIGVEHFDLNGEVKLDRLLKDLKPDVILMEASQEDLATGSRFLPALRRAFRKHRVDHSVGMAYIESWAGVKAYELRASKRYCASNGAQLGFLEDLATLSDEDLANGAEGAAVNLTSRKVTVAQIKKSSEELQRQTERRYMAAIEAIESGEEAAFLGKLEELYTGLIGKRDVVMGDKIRSVKTVNTERKIATITGFIHLLTDPLEKSMYCLTRDLCPERHILV